MKTYIHDAGKRGDGFGQEKMDCAVRAYAIAKEIPYAEAHELFKKLGRKDNKGTSLKIIQAAFGGALEQRIGSAWVGVTLKRFLSEFRTGIYFVFNRHHAFCIKEGVIFDQMKHTGHTKVYGYWKVA